MQRQPTNTALPWEDNGSNSRTVMARFCKEKGRRCKEAIRSSQRHGIQDLKNCGTKKIAVGCY